MIDADYFTHRLSLDVAAKGRESADQPSMELYLTDGTVHRVSSLVKIEPGYIVLEVYPRTLKKHSSEDRKAGAPAFKLDRLTVPYHTIAKVILTLTPAAKGVGFTP